MTRVLQRPNFDRLRRDVRIEAVCDYLHIELKRMGKQLRGRCPLCGHRSARAFVVTPAIGRFWCFGHCKAGGDALDLYAQVKQMTLYQAACEMQQLFNTS